MIWALLAVLAVGVVAALIWPLVRDQSAAEEEGRDLAVLRDQLTELDRDVARGVITTAEADALRLEIQRRVLSAARRPATAVWRESPGLRSGLTAALAVSVPMAAFAIYMSLGAPTLRTPERAAPAAAGTPDHDMAGLVDQLASRMAADPNNAEGWALLARSYRQIERYDDALAAYKHLISLNPDGAEPYANYGEMIVTTSGGAVTVEAQQAFVTALTRDRADPRSKFYLGLAAAQDNDPRTAIAIWRELSASSPPDAPWMEMVKGQMFQVAQGAAIMPMNVEPRHPLDGPAKPGALTPTPKAVQAPPSDPNDITAPDVSAIKGQFSGENLEQIQAMVGTLAGRLENNPDDFQGWMMLARSYTVLRNADGAKRAYEKAMALKPGDLQPKLGYVSVMMGTIDLGSAAPLPVALVNASAEILRLEPGQPDALFVRGLVAANTGDKASARRDWTAAKKSAQGPLAAELDRRLKALK